MGVSVQTEPRKMSVKLNLSIKGPFLPGETIRGALAVDIPLGIFLEISGIYLQFRGFERIRFRQRAEANATDDFEFKGTTAVTSDMSVNTGIPTILPISQPHFLQKVLISLTIPISRFRGKLTNGSHSFPFDFKLEGKLPPSINFASGSKYSAAIEYEIFVQVFCKNFDNLTSTLPIKLNNLVGKNQLPSFHDDKLVIRSSLSSCLFSLCLPIYRGGNQEEVCFHADWKRNNFTSGDAVDFTFSFELLQSSAGGLFSVKLVRELFLIIDERNSFRKIDPITKSKFPLIHGKDADQICGSTQLVIPWDLEPSVKTKAIDCRYFFVFEIKLRGRESSLTTAEVHIY